MMTSLNGNIFHVTGPLWAESTGHRWIPLTKANDALMFSLMGALTNTWTLQIVVISDAMALIMMSL